MATDLTQHPPRSPRVRLGGYVLLPRLLDKGRASLIGKQGEYHYNCPLDQRFFEYVGLSADAIKEQLAMGKNDTEMLDWIKTVSPEKHSAFEIAAWSRFQEERVPTDIDSRQYFNDLHAKTAPKREDINTWFDLLDVDDYASYGGAA